MNDRYVFEDTDSILWPFNASYSPVQVDMSECMPAMQRMSLNLVSSSTVSFMGPRNFEAMLFKATDGHSRTNIREMEENIPGNFAS
jgi:hypothetical protein